MDPYETDPAKVPSSDAYRNDNGYGRYRPHADDFKPDPQHINSSTPESLAYWASVLDRCTPEQMMCPGGRDVFSLGGVIVKSSHLNEEPSRDYSLADANEIAAIALAKPVLAEMQIRVPEIYFAGKIDGRAVLVQERLPGVCLNVASPYLSKGLRASFREQARTIMRRLHAIKPHRDSPSGPRRSYVVPDPDPVANRGVQELERDIIFVEHAEDADVGFVHNDLSESNLIVMDDRIVGVIDWEMAGFFGWATAADVHRRVRGCGPENYVGLGLAEDVMERILYWTDLFDCEGP